VRFDKPLQVGKHILDENMDILLPCRDPSTVDFNKPLNLDDVKKVFIVPQHRLSIFGDSKLSYATD